MMRHGLISFWILRYCMVNLLLLLEKMKDHVCMGSLMSLGICFLA